MDIHVKQCFLHSFLFQHLLKQFHYFDIKNKLFTRAFMREPHSVGKGYNRMMKQYYSPSIDPYNTLLKPKQAGNGKLDVDNLQEFYLSNMIQIYEKNRALYPDPKKIIYNLRLRDKRLSEAEREIIQYKQQLKEKFKENQKLLNSETKTSLFDQNLSNKKIQEKVKKSLDQQYFRMKLRFMPLLQENMGSLQYKLKLSTDSNQNVLELIYENISYLIKTLKANVKSADQRAFQKNLKKFQFSQQKFIKQIKQLNQKNFKLDGKIIQLSQQIKLQNDQRKIIQKQKNELHTQIYKNHQQIVQKSKLLEQMRQKFHQNAYKIEGYQKLREENKKLIQQYQESLKNLQNNYSQLEQKHKQTLNINQKLQMQMMAMRRRIQQQISSNFPKNRQQISSTSIKMIGEIQQSKSEIINLQRQIYQLQEIIKRKDEENTKYKIQAYESQKYQVQKVISQWKATLQKIVFQYDKEVTGKDVLISALQNQLTQLQKQLGIKRSFEIIQEQIKTATTQKK